MAPMRLLLITPIITKVSFVLTYVSLITGFTITETMKSNITWILASIAMIFSIIMSIIAIYGMIERRRSKRNIFGFGNRKK
jgi:uncharacterized membrane protein